MNGYQDLRNIPWKTQSFLALITRIYQALLRQGLYNPLTYFLPLRTFATFVAMLSRAAVTGELPEDDPEPDFWVLGEEGVLLSFSDMAFSCLMHSQIIELGISMSGFLRNTLFRDSEFVVISYALIFSVFCPLNRLFC